MVLVVPLTEYRAWQIHHSGKISMIKQDLTCCFAVHQQSTFRKIAAVYTGYDQGRILLA